MLLYKLKQSQRKYVTILIRLNDIATPLQADQHAKDLGHGSFESPGYLTLG